MVLVDSGASHNFLSRVVVNELGIPIEPTQEFVVEVGDGHCVKNQGVCKGMELELPNLTVTQDFFLFELRGVDVVLGYE